MGDLNRDGIPNIVFARSAGTQMTVCLATGKRDANLLTAYSSQRDSRATGRLGLERQDRALGRDGVLDIVAASAAGSTAKIAILRNTNPQSWSLALQYQVDLSLAGEGPDLVDLDGDERPDAVVLVTKSTARGSAGTPWAGRRILAAHRPTSDRRRYDDDCANAQVTTVPAQGSSLKSLPI